ncbi:copper ABC transporter ATP-binding protein [Haloferax mucosum ATCC BAA-1512]|uniref:Copper ABC transporter ATP-binding protein n=1 Tax=Haloferax mucosum ATCC BAA-1512 TaxID=662479 RepID=M0I7P9_9EURY|nr:ABC transporter ATP-binding protein [Haloferax mucosum]ELZ92850.1 copper ABC transporter ATP-binding protein [Haloferax mucosum ATCC BAA-1512]
MAIELRSLTKRYGDICAVEDVSLTVEQGEVFGFLGPNGAGKSTTINILLDFVRPTAGRASIFGIDPQEDPRAARERLGVLSEATGFYERDTAREHLEFAIAMKRADDDPQVLLERVGIADAADRAVGGFSKGMRQRLGLAIALVGEPDLIILDEPLGGLDPTGAQTFRNIIREERDRGAAVFFSSHIMDQVEAICDRVGIMNDGRLVAVDTVEALRTTPEVPFELSVTLDMIPDRIQDDLLCFDGVEAVSTSDGVLRVGCADASAKADVITHLDDTEAAILDVRTGEPSLEQVFMETAVEVPRA